jgi:hypothetical protein
LLRIGVDDRLRHLEGVAGQFQLLDVVQLTDVAVRPDELETTVSSASELDSVWIVEITRH